MAATPSRLTVARVIAWRDTRAMLGGWGLYVTMAAALVAAAWMLSIDLGALRAAGALVPSDPFGPPLEVALSVVALFIAVSAAVSVARERASGTLEVLFFGAIDEISYLAGKAGGLMLAYACALPVLLLCFAMLSRISGFDLSAGFAASLALSLVPIAEIICFGILLSVCSNRIRTAILLLLAIAAMLVGISIAYRVVLMIPVSDPASAVLPLRDALASVEAIVGTISPFTHLRRTIEIADGNAWASAPSGLVAPALGAAVMLALAAILLRRRGVQRREE